MKDLLPEEASEWAEQEFKNCKPTRSRMKTERTFLRYAERGGFADQFPNITEAHRQLLAMLERAAERDQKQD